MATFWQKRRVLPIAYKNVAIVSIILGVSSILVSLIATFIHPFAPIVALACYVSGGLLIGITLLAHILHIASYSASTHYNRLLNKYIAFAVVTILISTTLILIPIFLSLSMDQASALFVAGVFIALAMLVIHILQIERTLWLKRGELSKYYRYAAAFFLMLGLIGVFATLIIVWAGQPFNLALVSVLVASAMLTVITSAWHLVHIAANSLASIRTKFSKNYERLAWGYKAVAALAITVGVSMIMAYFIVPFLPTELLMKAFPEFLLTHQLWLIGLGIPVAIGGSLVHLAHIIYYQPEPKTPINPSRMPILSIADMPSPAPVKKQIVAPTGNNHSKRSYKQSSRSKPPKQPTEYTQLLDQEEGQGRPSSATVIDHSDSQPPTPVAANTDCRDRAIGGRQPPKASQADETTPLIPIDLKSLKLQT